MLMRDIANLFSAQKLTSYLPLLQFVVENDTTEITATLKIVITKENPTLKKNVGVRSV